MAKSRELVGLLAERTPVAGAGLLTAVFMVVCISAAIVRADVPASQPAAELSEGATVLDQPLSVYLVQTDKTIVRGKLAAYDAQHMKVVRDDGSPVLVSWSNLTPMVAYGTRRRLIDANDARAHFQLGLWCWNLGLKTEATAEFGQARKLDADYAEKVQQVYDGKYQPEAVAAQPDDIKSPPPPPPTGDDKADAKTTRKFQILSEAESKAALEETRKAANEKVQTVGIRMRSFESTHFLIFSNWPKHDDAWLRDIHEKMYRGLAGQFGLDPNENIWYGKLPIYAFETAEQFQKFAKEIDRSSTSGAAGYALCRSDGRGHIVIWRSSNRKQLSSVIVHEGTHAFLSRYRSNIHVISWLNEGLAQMMEEIGVPGSTELARARRASAEIVRKNTDISSIFTNRGNIPFTMYPVALTMTDMLLKRSKSKYVGLIHDIKDGMAVDEALKKNYEWTYEDLEKHWRRWAAKEFN